MLLFGDAEKPHFDLNYAQNHVSIERIIHTNVSAWLMSVIQIMLELIMAIINLYMGAYPAMAQNPSGFMPTEKLIVFPGVSKETFYPHLKKKQFRFNNRQNNLYKILLTMFRSARLI